MTERVIPRRKVRRTRIVISTNLVLLHAFDPSPSFDGTSLAPRNFVRILKQENSSMNIHPE